MRRLVFYLVLAIDAVLGKIDDLLDRLDALVDADIERERRRRDR